MKTIKISGTIELAVTNYKVEVEDEHAERLEKAWNDGETHILNDVLLDDFHDVANHADDRVEIDDFVIEQPPPDKAGDAE